MTMFSFIIQVHRQRLWLSFMYDFTMAFCLKIFKRGYEFGCGYVNFGLGLVFLISNQITGNVLFHRPFYKSFLKVAEQEAWAFYLISLGIAIWIRAIFAKEWQWIEYIKILTIINGCTWSVILYNVTSVRGPNAFIVFAFGMVLTSIFMLFGKSK